MRLMADYSELLAVPDAQEPGLIDRTALGAVLQSFYNGVENIFQTVAKRVDQDMPAGADWHRQLWAQMARATAARPPLTQPRAASPRSLRLERRHALVDPLVVDAGDGAGVRPGRETHDRRQRGDQYAPPSLRWSQETMRVGVKRRTTRLLACFMTRSRASGEASAPA